MISLPAPEDPPMIETIKLGVMAINLVIKFLSHFLIFNSKKPYDNMKNNSQYSHFKYWKGDMKLIIAFYNVKFLTCIKN